MAVLERLPKPQAKLNYIDAMIKHKKTVNELDHKLVIMYIELLCKNRDKKTV